MARETHRYTEHVSLCCCDGGLIGDVKFRGMVLGRRRALLNPGRTDGYVAQGAVSPSKRASADLTPVPLGSDGLVCGGGSVRQG